MWGNRNLPIAYKLLGNKEASLRFKPLAKQLIGNSDHRHKLLQGKDMANYGHFQDDRVEITWSVNQQVCICAIRAKIPKLIKPGRVLLISQIYREDPEQTGFSFYEIEPKDRDDYGKKYQSLNKVLNSSGYITSSNTWSKYNSAGNKILFQLATLTTNVTPGSVTNPKATPGDFKSGDVGMEYGSSYVFNGSTLITRAKSISFGSITGVFRRASSPAYVYYDTYEEITKIAMIMASPPDTGGRVIIERWTANYNGESTPQLEVEAVTHFETGVGSFSIPDQVTLSKDGTKAAFLVVGGSKTAGVIVENIDTPFFESSTIVKNYIERETTNISWGPETGSGSGTREIDLAISYVKQCWWFPEGSSNNCDVSGIDRAAKQTQSTIDNFNTVKDQVKDDDDGMEIKAFGFDLLRDNTVNILQEKLSLMTLSKAWRKSINSDHRNGTVDWIDDIIGATSLITTSITEKVIQTAFDKGYLGFMSIDVNSTPPENAGDVLASYDYELLHITEKLKIEEDGPAKVDTISTSYSEYIKQPTLFDVIDISLGLFLVNEIITNTSATNYEILDQIYFHDAFHKVHELLYEKRAYGPNSVGEASASSGVKGTEEEELAPLKGPTVVDCPDDCGSNPGWEPTQGQSSVYKFGPYDGNDNFGPISGTTGTYTWDRTVS